VTTSVSDTRFDIAGVPAAFFDPGHDRNILTILIGALYALLGIQLNLDPNWLPLACGNQRRWGFVFDKTLLGSHYLYHSLGGFRNILCSLVPSLLLNLFSAGLPERRGCKQQLLAQLGSLSESG